MNRVVKKRFRKNSRLNRSKEFQFIFKKRNIFRESCCTLYISPNSHKQPRLGVILSKKVVSLSTQRHQWKRIVRESFRLNASRLIACDVIVMLRKPPYNKAQLWRVLGTLWDHVQNWRPLDESA